MIRNILLITMSSAFLLAGCNNSSSTSDDDTALSTTSVMVLTGIFVDSAVEGISYSTATQVGTTNSNGEFQYVEGEQVTFSIGATQLPTVNAAPQISPIDMGAGSTDPGTTTTNIARLLQSLDVDGNPDNGITISPVANLNASIINFDVSIEEFENNTDVINLVANSGSTNSALISAEEANQHLSETLGIELIQGAQNIGEIILDLRDTAWLSRNLNGCDGEKNNITLMYSQTGLSTFSNIAENLGDGCVRVDQIFEERSFAEIEAGAGISSLLVCGGDGLCTADELNRTIFLDAGDVRNTCTIDGISIDVDQAVTHEIGSNRIIVNFCDPDRPSNFLQQ